MCGICAIENAIDNDQNSECYYGKEGLHVALWNANIEMERLVSIEVSR